MNQSEQDRARQGIFFAIAGYTMWGIAPIYFKAIHMVPAAEILCHRVIWSFLLLTLLVHVSHKWRDVRNVLASKKNLIYDGHLCLDRRELDGVYLGGERRPYVGCQLGVLH